MIKTVILIGGPAKGTRFRPLSLDIPKPLFPVAGFPMIYHHIEAASKVPGMKEVILIGSYHLNEDLNKFIQDTQKTLKIFIRYLQEYTALGTAGGMYHFRDQIMSGQPECFFTMNCDVCCDFPLNEMLQFHRSKIPTTERFTILATEATRHQSLNYGCIAADKETGQVCHYVEKPDTFVSTSINCGVYLFDPSIFKYIGEAFKSRQEKQLLFDMDPSSVASKDCLRLEQDLFAGELLPSGSLYVFHTNNFWSQIKNAGAAVYANRHCLHIYARNHPERLAVMQEGGPKIIGDVFIHHTATVDPSATLGPNVTIGMNVTVGAGVRVRESIILKGSVLQDHCCVLHSIIGWDCVIGQWSRVEGTPNDPNPNKPFAKLDIPDLFNSEGKLNPSITVIGSNVNVPPEVIVLNTIILPHKGLSHSCKNQIIL